MGSPVRLCAAVLVAALAACGAERAPAGDGRLRVVTTVSPLTNIAENVAGNLVDITGVVPEGRNSHEFEPAPSVARALARADVVFVNGLQLEAPTIELAETNVRASARIVELGRRTIEPADYVFDFSFPRDKGVPNPHLWTNPPYAKRYAEVMAQELAALDEDNATTYAANAKAFGERVDALDAALREATQTVPPERRKLLTYHDSFPYFAREYGWTVVGAVQPSDFSEPSAREVASLIGQIRDEGVPAVFGSEVFPSPVLERIAAESGARYVPELRDDDLPGEPGDPEHTWMGLMRFDFVTIVEALGGDATALRALDVSNVTRASADYGGGS